MDRTVTTGKSMNITHHTPTEAVAPINTAIAAGQMEKGGKGVVPRSTPYGSLGTDVRELESNQAPAHIALDPDAAMEGTSDSPTVKKNLKRVRNADAEDVPYAPLTVKLRITFTEEVLGTASANPDLVRDYIASKRPEGVDPAEIEAIPALDAEIQKAMTVFARENGQPILWDYQVRGMFKDSCASLARISGTASNKLTAFRKVIDGSIFVNPRKLFLVLPTGCKVGICERPLRAQTPQGERIALARSETCPEGTYFDCEVVLLAGKKHLSLLTEWLNYGALRGLGQWRGSGKGRLKYVIQK